MPTRDAWLRAVRGVVLKSNPDGDDAAFAEAFTRQLVSETEDGVEIQPLYDSSEPIDVGLPGFAPYVRSTHAAPSPWEIRQRAWPAVDGSSARGELEGGATGVLVELPAEADAALVAQALDGVFLELAPVSLSTPANDVGLTAAQALAGRWDAAGIVADERRGTLGVDPVGTWVRTGGATDLASALADAASPRQRADRERPARQGRGRRRHRVARRRCDRRAGDRLERRRRGAHRARPRRGRGTPRPGQPPARVPLGRDRRPVRDDRQVPRRPPRCGRGSARSPALPPADRTSSTTPSRSPAMMTRYDPWVNALRSTVACFAAGDGRRRRRHRPPPRRPASRRRHGARPADRPQHPVGPARWSRTSPGSSTRPAARGTSSTSPTSWPQAAWAVQEIEAAGGIVAARRGRPRARARSRGARAPASDDVATRRQPLTGLSEFPDIDEPPPPAAPAPSRPGPTAFAPLRPRPVRRATSRRQRGRADAPPAPGPTGGLPRHARHAGRIHGRGPRSPATSSRPPGIATRRRSGSDDFAAVAARRVACLCSTDPVYAERRERPPPQLRAAGAGGVYVAGRKLGLAGVDEEIGAGSDVLDVVTATLDLLGTS